MILDGIDLFVEKMVFDTDKSAVAEVEQAIGVFVGENRELFGIAFYPLFGRKH